MTPPLLTSLQCSVHPNVYLSVHEGSALYKKWYFEVELTQLSCKSAYTPHFRVGWAHASLFQPYPTSNSIKTTCKLLLTESQPMNKITLVACRASLSSARYWNSYLRSLPGGGIGDDVYSLAFDGESFWVGGHGIEPSSSKRLQRQFSVSQSPMPPERAAPISVGDVIGCCLDLEREVAWFMRNGSHIPGHLVFHHCREMVTPAISFSAGVRCDKVEETMGQEGGRGGGGDERVRRAITNGFYMSWNKL